MCVFVDGIFRIALCPDHDWETAAKKLIRDGEVLDEEVGRDGYKQNCAKEEVVAAFKVRPSNWDFFKINIEGLQSRSLHQMKHLGALLCPFNTLGKKRAARRAACAAGWNSLYGFWFSRAPTRVKELLFSRSCARASHRRT